MPNISVLVQVPRGGLGTGVYLRCDPRKQKSEIKARKEEKSLKGAFSRSVLGNGALAEKRAGPRGWDMGTENICWAHIPRIMPYTQKPLSKSFLSHSIHSRGP